MSTPSSLPTSFVHAVALLTEAVFAQQAAAAKESGFSDLSLRQIAYLDRIQRMGNPTPSELAAAFQVSRPTISIALDRLEEAGYVRRSQSDEDRRSFHIHLTEKGENFHAIHQQVHQELAGLFTIGLDKDEIQQLERLFNKIVAGLPLKAGQDGSTCA